MSGQLHFETLMEVYLWLVSYMKVLAHKLVKFDWHVIALLISGRFVVTQSTCGRTLKIAFHHKKMVFLLLLPQNKSRMTCT